MDNQLLIVDHSNSRRSSLKTLLASKRFEVLEARTCEEALALLEESPAPVVLTDTELPTKSGLYLLQQVKQHYPETEVILLTHNASSYNLLQALRLGAFDFIVRPIDTGDILPNALERAFMTVALRRENLRQMGELQKKNRQLSHTLQRTRSLLVAVERMAARQDIGELLQELLDSAVDLLQAERGFLALANNSTGIYGIKLAHGLSAGFSQSCYSEIPRGLLTGMLERRKPVLVPDALPAKLSELANPLEATELLQTRGLVSAPLTREDRQLGMLVVLGHPDYQVFGQDELQLLRQLAKHAALCLEKAGMIRKLQLSQKNPASPHGH